MMNSFATLLFISISLTIPFSDKASAESSQQVEKAYTELFSSIAHLQVDFEQEVYKKLRDRTITRTGDAFFSKPSSFRWNFKSKHYGLEEYYYNGKTLTHFKEQDKSVNHYQANTGLARELTEIVNLVLDPKNLFDRYQVDRTEKKSGITEVSLSPRPAVASDIKAVDIVVGDKNSFIQRVKILYMDGNYTQFTFKNPKFTANKPEIFTFSRQGSFNVRHHK